MAITVTAAAESRKLTTVANFKEMMDITVSTYDTFLGKLIDRASQAIVTYCGREFAKETVSETLSSKGNPFLWLSRTPVVSITSISHSGDALDTDEYDLQEPTQGKIFNTSGSWLYTGLSLDYTVVYVAGYVLPSFASGTITLPEDVQAAALELTKLMWLGRKQDSSVKSESVPDVYTVEYGSMSSGKLLTSNGVIVDLLSPYRRFKL